MTRQFLYWISPVHPSAVFATQDRVREVKKVLAARTWSDFKCADPEEFSREIGRREEVGEAVPNPGDPFEVSMVAGFDEGDYPPWLQAELEQCLPRALLDRYAKRQSSFLNGSFYVLPPANMEAVADALRELGHTARYEPDVGLN